MTTPTPPSREQIAAAMPAAIAVVKKISCYRPDYFKPTEELLLSWAEHFAAYAPNIPTEDLLTAVMVYYGTNITGDRAPHAAITQTAKQIRHERFMEQSIEVQNAIAEARDEARAHLLYDAEPALALPPPPRPESVMAAPEYTDCPACGAKAGFPCRNNTTGLNLTEGFHLPRINAAGDNAAQKRRALAPPEPKTRFCPKCDAVPGDPCTSGGFTMRDVHDERRSA